MVPATGPANATLPAAGARTSSPTEAAMSIPRCPGPYGPARASKPRTTAPATGIHNGGTGGGPGAVGGGGNDRPVTAAGAATGTASPIASTKPTRNSGQPKPRRTVNLGYAANMGPPGNRGAKTPYRIARTLFGGTGQRAVIHRNCG